MIIKSLQLLNVEKWIIDGIEYCFYNNYIKIDNKYYRQTDGIIMGSVIGPKLAEIYLINLDKFILSYPGLKFMARYVDDVLCIIDSNIVNTTDLQKYVNSYNENIKFTIEHNSDNIIIYLDITLVKHKDKIKFKRYWKEQNNLNY